MRLAHAARRDVRQCAKKIKKNVHRIEKRRTFAATMKRMYLQYEIQCACPSVLAERFVVNTPPVVIRCQSTVYEKTWIPPLTAGQGRLEV